MNKKILFFYPNTTNHAVISPAIPILAGIAHKRGWDIWYFDTSMYEKPMDATEEKEMTGGFRPGFVTLKKEMPPSGKIVLDFQAKIDEINPDILVISAMSSDYQYLMGFFGKIKIPDKTLVVIGGIHAIIQPKEVISTGLFDLVCTGQGEETFDEILARIEENMYISDIEGTYFYDKKNESIICNPMRMLLGTKDLWNIDPHYGIFDNRYFVYPFDGKMVRMFWMEVSRGCPYNCSFCGNTALRAVYKGLGKYICTRPMDSIFKIFKKIIDTYRIDIFNITDECFLSHQQDWLEEFAERYAENVRSPFLIQTRPETVTEKNIEILLSCIAPFFQVGMGVESGSERILFNVCNRRTKVKDIIRAYDLLNKYGIRSNAYFMIGFPYETRDDIFKTIELCKRIKSTINVVSIFQPLPGTKLRELCIKKRFITGDEPLATFTSGSVLKMPQISAEEISNLRRTFMLYAKLSKDYYPQIEKCEKDYENNKELFKELVDLRWSLEA